MTLVAVISETENDPIDKVLYFSLYKIHLTIVFRRSPPLHPGFSSRWHLPHETHILGKKCVFYCMKKYGIFVLLIKDSKPMCDFDPKSLLSPVKIYIP